jgi:hypothetical protein
LGQKKARFEAELDMVASIFPACDPLYIRDQLELRAGDEDRVKTLSSELLELGSYPLLQVIGLVILQIVADERCYYLTRFVGRVKSVSLIYGRC